MNHSSNEVKQLLATVCSMLAKTVPPQQMAPELLRLLIPMLVNGTKEKNSYVKASSEFALVSVLRLRQGDETQQVSYCYVIEYHTLQPLVQCPCTEALSEGENQSMWKNTDPTATSHTCLAFALKHWHLTT
jgi:hypothetical protein